MVIKNKYGFHLNNRTTETQDKFKLLGVILDFRAHIKEQLKKKLAQRQLACRDYAILIRRMQCSLCADDN